MLKVGHVKKGESLECVQNLDLGTADISTQGEAEGVMVSGLSWQQAGLVSRALPADAVTLW